MATKRRSPIGPVKEGGFHRWLDKGKDAPITQADIQRGLAAGGQGRSRGTPRRSKGRAGRVSTVGG